VFWSDLAKILQVLVVSRDQEFRAKTGHYTANQLPPFIAQVRTLLSDSVDRPGWDADARGTTRVILANALSLRVIKAARMSRSLRRWRPTMRH
jgi:hypothetical protein